MPIAYICQGVRTPIGRYGGALATVRTDDLAAHPLVTLKRRFPNSDWESIDEVYYGCVNQAGEDNRNVARMALLLADLPMSVPGVTVNRLCASSMEAVAVAARAHRHGRDVAGDCGRCREHEPVAVGDAQSHLRLSRAIRRFSIPRSAGASSIR